MPGRLEPAVQLGASQNGPGLAGKENPPWFDIIVDHETAEVQAGDGEHLIRATTRSPVGAGRHAVRVVGRAQEALLHWVKVRGASTVVEK